MQDLWRTTLGNLRCADCFGTLVKPAKGSFFVCADCGREAKSDFYLVDEASETNASGQRDFRPTHLSAQPDEEETRRPLK